MDATNNEIDRISKLVDNIRKESRHFDVIISNNEKSVNSITAKELNKIVDQFR